MVVVVALFLPGAALIYIRIYRLIKSCLLVSKPPSSSAYFIFFFILKPVVVECVITNHKILSVPACVQDRPGTAGGRQKRP